MELKQAIIINVQKGENNFSFQMPLGASWGSAVDAAFDVLNEINRLAQKSIEAAKPSQPVVDQSMQEA